MESIPTRVDTWLPGIREEFANVLEERYTAPKAREDFSAEDIEAVRNGQQILNRGRINETLIRIAQDFRLSHDETDELLRKIFLSE